MGLPVVAIVGRPNVGKSSLLNCIARRMIGIVDPTPGVTRDRVSTVCNVDDVYFELVDTGGFGIEDHDNLTDHVEQQIRYAIVQSALILFVVDVRESVTPLDEAVARLLRQHDRRVLLVANKVDEFNVEPLIGEFHKLGFGGALPISAHHNIGRRELLERIAKVVGPLSSGAVKDPVMKIAVVGKRNSGKSTFINSIAGEERVIVSEVPGTTRDAVDVRFEKDGRQLLVIDTAGVRKKNKMATDIEFYGFVRAQRSIMRADVVLLFIDATVPVSQVDKKLARFIADNDKPCVLVVNKWDLAKGKASTSDYGEYLTKMLPEVNYAPISTITAKDGRGVLATIDLATSLFKQARTRVGTARLNEVLESAKAQHSASPRRGNKAVKIYYGTQVGTTPPTVVVFVNRPDLIRDDYRRFLLNRLREQLPFSEVPIRLVFRSHRRDPSPAGVADL
ncbi:MAG: ribosome biogenesis GTPase Der [Planctomycetes bacterium]|nr:ribosome biogenesis GTPase Der [Planctomycetota bacterium]